MIASSLVEVDYECPRSCAGCGARSWLASTPLEVERAERESGVATWPGIVGAYFWTCSSCGDVAVEAVGGG